jgi:hypothetical protein
VWIQLNEKSALFNQRVAWLRVPTSSMSEKLDVGSILS